MDGITDEDIALLRKHARERDGRWAFDDGGPYCHSQAEAVAIIGACLALGVPVTDRLTSFAWNNVVTRLAALEARVSELEPLRAQPRALERERVPVELAERRVIERQEAAIFRRVL